MYFLKKLFLILLHQNDLKILKKKLILNQKLKKINFF